MLRDTRFVDEVPGQPGYIAKVGCNRRNQRALPPHRLGIEVRIDTSQDIRQEREEVELYWKAILASRHQVCLKRAQRFLVWLSVFIAELVPSGPPTGSDHVEPRLADLSQVTVPDVHVGVFEVEPLYLARHVRRSDHGERFAVQFEVIAICRESRPRAQVRFVANPKTRMVYGAKLIALH